MNTMRRNKRKVRKIHKKDLENFLRSWGESIHGIPLLVSPKYCYDVREMEDGYQIYRYYTPLSHLHNSRGKHHCYICHPSKREELESEIRRN